MGRACDDGIEAQLFAALPAELARGDGESSWAREVLGARYVDSFLEGPCFDRDGALFVSDLAHGRILRVNRGGQMSVLTEYDGEPNGMAFHRDGTLYVADYRRGLLTIDAAGQPHDVASRHHMEPFRGLSDLVFDSRGALYFSDQGQSDLRFPTGRVFRRTPDGNLELLMDGIASPNGLALSPAGDVLYISVTRANAVYRMPLRPDGSVGKVGVHLHLSGGSGGPDGLAATHGGGLAVAHYGLGRVWLFDADGLLQGFVSTPTGRGTTNVAFGGDGLSTMYVTEATSSSVLVAQAPVGGVALFSHRDVDASG